jgi:hypothetical protein
VAAAVAAAVDVILQHAHCCCADGSDDLCMVCNPVPAGTGAAQTRSRLAWLWTQGSVKTVACVHANMLFVFTDNRSCRLSTALQT